MRAKIRNSYTVLGKPNEKILHRPRSRSRQVGNKIIGKVL